MGTCWIDFEPLGRRAECVPGETLLDAARRAGVALAAICGGAGSCGRCRVRVMVGDMSSPSETEIHRLGTEAVEQGMRLACQTRIQGGVKVYVPADSLSTTQRLQVEGQAVRVAPNPPVLACPVELPPAALTDLRADAVRLRDALREAHGFSDVALDFAVAQTLPDRLRAQGWRGVAHVRRVGGRAEVVRFGAPDEQPLGLAVDLGTTKIAAHLVDLQTGLSLAADGVMNPQIAFGEDVMARIGYAMQGERQARELQEAVVAAIGGLAQALCGRAGRTPREIVEAVVVGNTAMHHLFVGLPVRQLGAAPYVPAESAAMDVKARDIGLALGEGAYVHLLPNVAGFVGADHVAMLLGTGIPDMDGVVLGLDIGTNTELVLKTPSRLISCSTASGPAFEGAHIRDGMRAASGAIEWVSLDDGEVHWQTVDNAPPVGICGSGVLDAVAALRRAGVLTAAGRMLDHPRVRRGDDGLEFVLAAEGETGHGRPIAISRKDVSAIQLAKGAIRAGIELLMAEAGVAVSDLDAVILAGAFGTYLSVDSILEIGLLPPVPAARVHQVGNAAAVGARLALVSLDERERARAIAARAEYLELTILPEFPDAFAKAMLLSP
ncbi:MAG: ASKHA domain-containing protein [Anaerolineales bacterium]